MKSTMKAMLRKQLKAKRELMSPSERERRSQKLCELLSTLLHSQTGCTIALYHPTDGEVDVFPLLDSPTLQKRVWALPVCEGEGVDAHLKFAKFASTDTLEKGRYGISVPKNRHWVAPDFVLVPCLGANREGFRLGYGAGWYDKTLNRPGFNAIPVGVVWDEALVDDSFQEPHDAPLHYLVTTSEIVSFK